MAPRGSVSPTSTSTLSLSDAYALATLAVLLLGFFLHLPRHGDIWWMDASRHAMNGAFVLDFLRAMPFRHPVDFAYSYYVQWPALTILFYPPLFYVSLALGYALFGVSESSAILVEIVWLYVLAAGCFRLSRHWLGTGGALAVALTILAGQEVFYWGQQIMLDIPAYALVVWSAYHTVVYLQSHRKSALLLATILAVLAVWTKYNAVCFLIIMAIALLWERGIGMFREKATWQAIAVGLALFIPVVVLFFSFGRYNLTQAYAMGSGFDRVREFLVYARLLPGVLSWPVIVLSIVFVVAATVQPRYRIDRPSAVLLIAWVVVMYLFYSTIHIKEPRHILMIGYPLALVAVLVVDRSLRGWRWRGTFEVSAAAALLLTTFLRVPIPYVSGMRAAATIVAKAAPHDTNVAVWCRYDGTFVFDMRAYGKRPDLGIVRLDKVLFRNVTVGFDRGYKSNHFDVDSLLGKMKALHVQYVVFQTGYMQDAAPVAVLAKLLATGAFVHVGSVKMAANYAFSPITTLQIYRLKEKLPPGRPNDKIQIGILGRSI